jgi:hypothetical protein
MASLIENNKAKNRSKERPNSNAATTITPTSTIRDFKKEQDTDSNAGEAKRTRRRTTKVGLDDTLRRIRHLITEGRSNLEIQDILQLEERTFYRYMHKIYKIDQALFAEQEKDAIVTEIHVFKDRMLNAYRWLVAMADNENMHPAVRMEAQRNAIDMAWALMRLELEGPRLVHKEGLLEKSNDNSLYHKFKKAEGNMSRPSPTLRRNEEEENAGSRKPSPQGG